MKPTLALTSALVLLTTMLFAHGNEQHVMGTILNVTDTVISVKAQDGHSVDVGFTKETKFMKGGQAVSARDLKKGDRVVIHASKTGEKLVATTVAIGKTTQVNPQPLDSPHQ